MPATKSTVSRWKQAHEVAETYGISVGTVYNMAKDGQLPHIKVRGTYRFQIDEVDKALRAQSAAEKSTA